MAALTRAANNPLVQASRACLATRDPGRRRVERAMGTMVSPYLPASGTTERGHHTTDPHSGRLADELLTVTVAGQDLARADAYATAAFAMAIEGLRWVDALPGHCAAGITHDARLITTRGLDHIRA